MARWRTASELRAGMPSPWRVKALRSDGQVVPSSVVIASVSLHRSASSYVRVLSEANVEQDAAVARMRPRPAA
jgi:hypothetical protein